VSTSQKQYLGDGVYIALDSFGSVVLTTENGIEVTNTIVLERETLAKLLQWLKEVK